MLRDGLSSLLEKPRSQCGNGSSKPCTTACLGSAKLGGLACLLRLWRIGDLGMFHPASQLCQPVPGMIDAGVFLLLTWSRVCSSRLNNCFETVAYVVRFARYG